MDAWTGVRGVLWGKGGRTDLVMLPLIVKLSTLTRSGSFTSNDVSLCR